MTTSVEAIAKSSNVDFVHHQVDLLSINSYNSLIY